MQLSSRRQGGSPRQGGCGPLVQASLPDRHGPSGWLVGAAGTQAECQFDRVGVVHLLCRPPFDNSGLHHLADHSTLCVYAAGAGAILVNPWNVNDLAHAIEYALSMGDAERRERHRQNYMHVTIHTAQTWADTFISELNDTHVEAELRTRNIPPQVRPQLSSTSLH